MLKGIREYLKPGSIEEFKSQALDFSGRFRIVAGGTGVNRFLNSGPGRDVLIDIKGLPIHDLELNQQELVIGAGVTINQLLRFLESRVDDQALSRQTPSLRGLYDACSSIASEPLRNLITFGGNLLFPFPWSDLPPVVSLLNCEMIINNGESFMDYSCFLSRLTEQPLTEGQIVTSFRFKLAAEPLVTSFFKYSLTRFDLASIDVALQARYLGTGKLAGLSAAIGGLGRVPRVLDCEQIDSLEAQDAMDDWINQRASELTAQAKVRNIRGFSDRQIMEELLRNLIGQELSKLLSRGDS